MSSQYIKIHETFCQLHLREIPADPLTIRSGLGFFLGPRHSYCLGVSLNRHPGLLSLSSPVGVILASILYLLVHHVMLQPPQTSHALKMPNSTLTFKWSLGWTILGWKSFLFRSLETWLRFCLTFTVAVEWPDVIMILWNLFFLSGNLFSICPQFPEISQRCALMWTYFYPWFRTLYGPLIKNVFPFW